jgi:RHS repeat-associated protein
MSKTNNLTGITSNYGYDAIYELQQVTQGGSTTESYSYDAVGNRLSSSGVPSYSYNPSNELTSTSSGSYTYDNDGNTLTDASGRGFTWDFENRVTQVVNPGVGTTTFRYDPFGRRIQKSGPLGTTNYLYDGKNSMEEVDSSGNVLARYTQTLSFDDPLAELRSGTTTYYQADGTKSITSLTDAASTVAGTYAYDAFGNLSSSTGSLTNPFRYTGREFDSETGLYYYRTRYYDSGIGRFASEDSIGFKGGVNFYPYVRNRPIIFGDPMGTCLWQFDSVTTTLGQCGKDPNKERQCACLCQISPEYAGCVKDCKDGCLSPKFSIVESCQCGCDQRHKNGELNAFETWACKQFCKLGGK